MSDSPSVFPVVVEDGLPDRPPAAAVRLAAVQFDPRIGEIDLNVTRVVQAVREAATRGAQLVALPECALTGYCFRDRDEALEYALPGDAPALAPLLDVTRELDLAVEVGYLERDGDQLRNVAVMIHQGRCLWSYRKAHLPHLGVDRFVDAGCQSLDVVKVGGLRVGLQICYDASFPEASRLLALAGADVILLPTNWPAEALLKADWLPNTRAYENVIYFAAINRVGEERGFVFRGKSRVCDPGGATLVEGPLDQEALLIADLFPERARTKKIERRGSDYFVDRIGDRRTDLYDLRGS